MKKTILLFILSLLLGFNIKSQVVTSAPTPLYNDSQNVVIYFHAEQGDRGLMGTSSSTAIYAHTGVCVTTPSGVSTDWKYAPAWLTNSPKYQLQYVSPNLWKLELGDLRSYYGVSDNEIITRLCFVFRDAAGNHTGRATGGGDIFLNVAGGQVSKPSTLTSAPPQGATRNPDGSVTFCIAAPGKSAVMVLGSWNDYTPAENQLMEYIDQKEGEDVFRYFTTTLPASTISTSSSFSYYYLVDNAIRVGDPYARLILDPYNDKYIPSSVFPDIPQYPSSKFSDIPLAWIDNSSSAYAWTSNDFTPAAKTDLIIYELLIRDFTGTESQALGNGTIRGAIEKIPYLKSLGVNAVELLPITEFNGNNSWGYNPNFYFAPDKAYGTPNDYKEFIDKCHAEGIAVFLDMVFNQSDGMHPWYRMYDPGENPFYNASAPHAYSVLNDWNQGYPLVEKQWKDALQYWLKEYRVDGFRFDLVKGLGNNDSYAAPTGEATDAYNQSRIDRMIRINSYMKEVNPKAICINEDLAGAQEENAMASEGLLNWVNVNSEGCNYAAANQNNSGLNRMLAANTGRTPGSTVTYLESHDEERLAYAAKTSPVVQVKGSKQIRMNRLGCAAAQMILVPGSHMIWQFSEMGNDQTTKSGSGNNTDPKYVNWNLLNDPLNLGLMETYRDLINLRLGNPSLFSQTQNFLMYCQSSDWANGRKIISTTDSEELYTAINPNISGSITIQFPFRSKEAGAYKILASTPDSNPTYDAIAGTITVQANSFATIGSTGIAAVKELNDHRNGLSFSLSGHELNITTSQKIKIISTQGIIEHEIAEGEHRIILPKGIHILSCGGHSEIIYVR